MKQYRNALKAFFKSHKQINTVKSGNQFNFNAKSDILYPIAHIEYQGSGTTAGQKRRSFFVTIADIFDPNLESSEEDIYSDTEEVANDCVDWFSSLIQTDYTVDEATRIEKFNNGHTDKVCGSTFVFTFYEHREANPCIIPKI